MAESLRSKTFKGAIWAFVERIGTQLVHFVVTIVLARLLQPSDYGVIGILMVYLSVSQLFVDCGFGSALIQKSNRTDRDFSTVFWYNLIIALICYTILFLLAPPIAQLYNMPTLVGMLRVLGLNLVIQAFYAIQVTRLTANVQFALQAKIAVFACVVSGVIGIALAYNGYGPWALVGQSMGGVLVSSIMFWRFSGWRPSFVFSRESFRSLFGFGSRIMAANFLHTIYGNLSPLIIGLKYSASDLGFYSRGDSLAALPGSVFQTTLGRVIYPVLSGIQNDEERLIYAYRKYLRLITSLVAPAMMLIAACAEPIVILLIGHKWLPCVPYLRLLAIAWVCDPIIVVNINILYVKGRSDVVLRLECVKKIIAIMLVVVSIQFGILGLCVGRLVYAYIALGLNIYYCRDYIGMGFMRQMKEVLPVYVASLVAALIAYGVTLCASCVGELCISPFLRSMVILVAAGGIGTFVYVILAWKQQFDFTTEGLIIVRNLLRKKQ